MACMLTMYSRASCCTMAASSTSIASVLGSLSRNLLGISSAAAREKINGSYVSRVLRLTLLTPAIVEAISRRLDPAIRATPPSDGPEGAWSAQGR